MTARRTDRGGRSRWTRPELIAALAAVAAAFAPASLTGAPVIDAIERALIAAFVTYIGAHGRRWAWLAAAVAITIPARGWSLVLALIALAIIVGAAVPRRRSRMWGAAGIGLLVNAAFWYPEGSAPWGAVLAIAAFALLVASGLPYLRRNKRKAVRITLIGVGVLILVAGVGMALAMGMAYRHVRSGGESARSALSGARNGDADAARASLEEAKTSFQIASSRVDGVLTLPARLVPGMAQQVNAVQVTVDQGEGITATADDLIATSDYDSLQYQGRLDLEQVRALAGPAATVDAELEAASVRLAEIHDGFLIGPLRGRIDQFADDIAEARNDTALASRLLEVTPALFGGDGDRRYLVVFVTPAELRGAGGFIGSYAELEASDGDVELTRSGRIADLIFGPNRGERKITGPDDYLRRYGRFNPGDFVQDATFSPHFPSSASVLSQIYPQAGGADVDGVIAVDPTGLAALLKLTGPIEVPGLDEPLTADNAVEVLTKQQYLDLPDEAERGQVLTDATKITFEKLISASLPAPRALAAALSPAARGGHIRLWSPEEAEQHVFERLGADGSLVIPSGSDGLSVIQQNSGNNKLDAYLHRSITYLPTVDATTGKVKATLRIELENDVPSLDLPDGVVGNGRGVPRGTNLTWLTIFTPQVVTDAKIDGKAIKLGPSTERALNAWDTPLVQIPAGGTVVIELELAGGIDLSEGYRLTILPQPVANADVFTSTLRVEGGSIEETGTNEEQLLDDEPIRVPTHLTVPIKR